jgi:hypothetical protein
VAGRTQTGAEAALEGPDGGLPIGCCQNIRIGLRNSRNGYPNLLLRWIPHFAANDGTAGQQTDPP